MTLTIRQATPADAATLIEFNRRMALETEGLALDLKLLTSGVESALADPAKCLYYVAENGGETMGQLGLTREWSDWRNGWFWWIQSVYIPVDHRRKGVFRALYEHVREQAKADPHVIGLRLYYDRGNTTARQTYLDLGMRETEYHLLEIYPLASGAESSTGAG